MGDQSAIEWTEATWNPIRGCSRVSEGCRHCYAELIAARFSQPGQAYHGLAEPRYRAGGGRWTGKVAFIESALEFPLRWRRPRRIFVNSMSDLFHEKVPLEWIDRIFSVMAQCPQHTFQVLTKRPERMRQWFDEPGQDADFDMTTVPWPLPNVWLGVSVEDQATADERIPLLLQTPAAVRWVSYEPALGPVDFGGITDKRGQVIDAVSIADDNVEDDELYQGACLDWLVVGGESGPGARPFDIAWARQTIAQGRAAGVPVFVKQVGSQPRGWCPWRHHDECPPVWLDKDGVLPSVSGQPPHDLCHALDDSWWSCSPRLRDRKGGDPAEWPEDLRVREYPR